MTLKLSLTTRAIILISMPLLFEIGSAFLLLDLQKQAEIEAERSLKARELSDRINNLTRETYSVWDTVSNTSKRAWLSEGYLSKAYKNSFARLRAQYQGVLSLSGDIPKLKSAVEDSLAAVNKAEAMLDEICLDMRAGHADEVLVYTREKQLALKQLYHRMLSQEFNLAAHDQEHFLAESPVRLREYRKRTVDIFLVALVGNVISSVILAVFLVGKVTRRLGHLASEVRKLGTGRPLSLPFTGSDEIASLSRAISTMSVELNAHLRKEGAIVANARDTICAIDDKGCFTSINPAGEELFNAHSTEIIAGRFIERVHTADREKARVWYQELLSGSSAEEVELRVLQEGGTVYSTLWSGQWSAADKTLFCVVHDVSERIELERVKQELVATLTHDLRSPLTTIQACFEMLEAGVFGQISARGQELVKVAERNGARMMNLINDLLDIEKIKSGMMVLDLAPVAVDELFEEVNLNLVTWLEERKITLKSHSTTLGVIADKSKVSRVLFNLVSNAVKFSPPNSRIVLNAIKEGAVVKISVTDHGAGIPADQQEFIFDRFAQVNSAEHKGKGGSGLGLTICQAIVLLHGGKIWVNSTEGLGTTFYFTLPSV